MLTIYLKQINVEKQCTCLRGHVVCDIIKAARPQIMSLFVPGFNVALHVVPVIQTTQVKCFVQNRQYKF